MAIYSIKDLEKLSGIKAHTLRIWEQRYAIIIPKRTNTNIRYYTDTDLRSTLNVALLNKNGYKISKIAELTSEEITEKVGSISEKNFEHDTQLDALTISMIEMDEYKFDRIITTNIQQMGFERTMMEVIHPFLDKLGLLWLTGSIHPVQENFMGYLVRQKIIVALDSLPWTLGKNVKKYLLYLPEGETQELSLLFMYYLLKSRQNQVIYIGQNMSMNDLKDVYNIHKPDYIYTMVTETFSRQPVMRYVEMLSKSFPESEILLSGYQIVAQNIESADNVTVLKSLQETIEFLDEAKTQREQFRQIQS
jgi:MerR family transcriptional regulator, light-induced transcriptional regulator